MLKGIYKEFVTVKISGNPVYDEAIFIMKRAKGDKIPNHDLPNRT